jgi:site-specific DNA-methyltransferase (adenine-specific)
MILLQGDCLELLKEIPDESVDLIFCDLPYGQTSCKWDCKIDLGKLWAELLRVKKLKTPLFFTTTTKFGIGLINSSPKNCPFRYDIVWAKSLSTSFLLAKKMPMRKHEMIYVFYEKLPFYDLSSHQHRFIQEPEVSKESYQKALPTSVIKEKGCYGEKVPNSEAKYGQKCAQQYDPPLPTSMLEIKSTRGKHSTEKPVALMEWILKYYSKEGDVVLDPTMGSGSMGVACQNLNRDFVGFEMDEEIFGSACQRLEG